MRILVKLRSDDTFGRLGAQSANSGESAPAARSGEAALRAPIRADPAARLPVRANQHLDCSFGRIRVEIARSGESAFRLPIRGICAKTCPFEQMRAQSAASEEALHSGSKVFADTPSVSLSFLSLSLSLSLCPPHLKSLKAKLFWGALQSKVVCFSITLAT